MNGSRLRADATRNRERIVKAARDAFVVSGAEAPLDEIAREAGVGNATLYRHFADREALIRHVVLNVMDDVARRAQEALDEEPDAFEALRRFAFGAAEERIGALGPVLSQHIDPQDPEIQLARSRLEGLTEQLLQRARRSGQLRDDVDRGDLLFTLCQLTRPLPDTRCVEKFASYAERHLMLFLDGLRAPARSVLPGRAATVEGLRKHS